MSESLIPPAIGTHLGKQSDGEGKAHMYEKEIVRVVENDDGQRIALGRLLRSVGYEIRLYSSAEEFIETSQSDEPGCLITEVRLQGLSGLELQRHLREISCALPVIVITGFADVPMSVQCMKAGAIDFLSKPLREQDVLDAVGIALRQDRCQRSTADRIASLQARYESLTSRERQVMSLVSAGKINKQIAEALDLSEVTVKIHRGGAMRKMRAQTLADLVKMAYLLDEHEVPSFRVHVRTFLSDEL
jgi:FixJ family two-component response regulator